MKKSDLIHLSALKAEIEVQKELILEFEALATSCTALITGGNRSNTNSDKVGRFTAKLADAKHKLETMLESYVDEYMRINEKLTEIEDRRVRAILLLRFVKGLPWVQVAGRIGPGYTPDSVKQTTSRFLNRYCK